MLISATTAKSIADLAIIKEIDSAIKEASAKGYHHCLVPYRLKEVEKIVKGYGYRVIDSKETVWIATEIFWD